MRPRVCPERLCARMFLCRLPKASALCRLVVVWNRLDVRTAVAYQTQLGALFKSVENFAGNAIVNFGGLLQLHWIPDYDLQSCLGQTQAATRAGRFHGDTERLLHGPVLLFDMLMVFGIHFFYGLHHAFFRKRIVAL